MAIATSLTSFMQFTGEVGPRRGRVPATLRAMYDDPTRHPWAYYGPMVSAIKAGFSTGDMSSAVGEALTVAQERALDARCRGQLKHYSQLAEGALELSRQARVTRTFTPPSVTWTHESLTIRVSPQLGVERRHRREVWLLHLKETPLTQATADPALIIMTEALETEPDLVPRVVDVRRAAVFGLAANRSRPRLAAWIRGEAELFVRLWEVPAA